MKNHIFLVAFAVPDEELLPFNGSPRARMAQLLNRDLYEHLGMLGHFEVLKHGTTSSSTNHAMNWFRFNGGNYDLPDDD